MDEIIDRIFEISRTKEGKNLLQMALKCGEEYGELSQAVLSYTEAPGCAYKGKTQADVAEEIADVFIVDVAMAVKAGITKEVLKEQILIKMNKWIEKITSDPTH